MLFGDFLQFVYVFFAQVFEYYIFMVCFWLDEVEFFFGFSKDGLVGGCVGQHIVPFCFEKGCESDVDVEPAFAK